MSTSSTFQNIIERLIVHADPILIVSFTTPNRYQWVAVSQFMNNVMSHPLSAPLTQQCFEVRLMGSLMNTCIDNGFTGRLGSTLIVPGQQINVSGMSI